MLLSHTLIRIASAASPKLRLISLLNAADCKTKGEFGSSVVERGWESNKIVIFAAVFFRIVIR